jgi:4-methylaminobutanoate oxidase (formaldehyde-forming)
LAAKGAVFGSTHGWECANYFSKAAGADGAPSLDKPAWLNRVKIEQRAGREAAALVDQSALSKILVQGRDALTLLQRLCSSDIDLPIDGRCETLLLNARGGIESLLSVIRMQSDVFMLVSGATQAIRDIHWLSRHQRDGEQLVLTDVSPMFTVLTILGPSAGQLLAHLSSDDFSASSLDVSTAKLIDLGFARMRAAAINHPLYTGFDLYVPVEMTRHVYLAIHEAGAALGLLDAGHYAFDALRIEGGRSAWGTELGPDDGPWEAGLGGLLSFHRSAFMGREAVLKAADSPVRKRLLKLVFQDPEAYAWGGEVIMVDGGGQVVGGDIRSAGWGFDADRCVALGYVYGELASAVHHGTPAKALIWGNPSPVLLYSL